MTSNLSTFQKWVTSIFTGLSVTAILGGFGMFIQFVRMDERLIVIQENIEKITQQPRFTHDHAAVLEARMNSKLALFDARITRAEGKLESYKERLRRLETVTKDEQ